MKNYGFNIWVSEYADFGLEMANRPKEEEPSANQDFPIQPLNVEYIVKSLRGKILGEKYLIPDNFFGELQWGEQDGAIKMSFSPLGGVRVILSKLSHNLEGDPVWICKKVIEVKNSFDDHPDKLSFEIAEQLNEIDNQDIDAPMTGYKGLERLVIQLATDLRRKTTQKIFIYEGIRVLKENESYIIHFGVSGMGVQARGQKRVDKFCIQCEYSNKTGIIKIAGQDLGDSIDKHRWVYDVSEFIDYFSPGQKADEIIEAIVVNFNCY